MTTFNPLETTAISAPRSIFESLVRRIAWILFLTGFALACQATGALAHEKNESRAMSVLKFTGGLISAYAFHEAGHALAAAATGTELDWGLGTYNQPLGFTERADDDTSGFLVHASGLTTQLIVSEIILQSDSIDNNDNFVRGIMLWNILNPLIYALDYWVIRSSNQKVGDYYQGDIQGVEHYSDGPTADAFAFGVSVLTVYQAYRYVKTQDWAPDWMKNPSVQLNFTPLGRDGAMLSVNIDF